MRGRNSVTQKIQLTEVHQAVGTGSTTLVGTHGGVEVEEEIVSHKKFS
jgi:hypothetical protein